MLACEYAADGTIESAFSGNAARLFASTYAGALTLRVDRQEYGEDGTTPLYPSAEVGPVFPAGWNIDGTPPASVDPGAAYLARLQAEGKTGQEIRAEFARVMKARGRRALSRKRVELGVDLSDPEFEDPAALAAWQAYRTELAGLLDTARNAATVEDLLAAFSAFAAAVR